MLTRKAVAKRLGKSLATVRRMEGRELHPEIDENGVHLFDEDDVEEISRGRAGTTRSPCRFVSPLAGSKENGHSAAAYQDAVRLGTELEKAEQRIAELTADQDELKGLLRMTAWLLLEVCPSSTLAHFDPELVAVIRGLREL